jgi:hypothetical protein
MLAGCSGGGLSLSPLVGVVDTASGFAEVIVNSFSWVMTWVVELVSFFSVGLYYYRVLCFAVLCRRLRDRAQGMSARSSSESV